MMTVLEFFNFSDVKFKLYIREKGNEKGKREIKNVAKFDRRFIIFDEKKYIINSRLN